MANKQHPYNVIRVPLSTQRTVAEEFQVSEGLLIAHRVPSPFTVRIGAPNADPITIDRPGRIAVCNADVGSIYITNTSTANDFAELVIARRGVVDVDFPVAGVAEPWEVVAHVIAGLGTPASAGAGIDIITSTARGGSFGLNGGTAATEYIQALKSHACRITLTTVGKRYVGYSTLQLPGHAMLTGGRNIGEWRWSDEVQVTNHTISRGLVYAGLYQMTAGGGVLSAAGVGFRVVDSGKTWRAHIGIYNGGVIDADPAAMDLDTGVSCLDVHELEVRLLWDGAPVVQWYIDGRQVAEHRGTVTRLQPLGTAQGGEVRPVVGAWSEDDAITILYHLGRGMRLLRRRERAQ